MTTRKQKRPPKYVNPVPSTDESVRKAELVARLLDYSAAHGLSTMSLRPLAAAIGSSPRMLLYFFGSKEGLIREVLATSRANQMELVEHLLHEDQQKEGTALVRLWEWLSDPEHADVERLFFESYGRSIRDEDDAWVGFAHDSVADWLPLVRRMLRQDDQQNPAEEIAAATLVLAALRGLLLDLLASGDRDRIQSAFDLLQPMLNNARGTSSPQRPARRNRRPRER
jgi:AcrR family transcriptional regulator